MRKYHLLGIILTATLLLSTTGCGPRLSEEELGEKLDKLPVIEGVEEPFPLPGLEDIDEPPADTPDSASPQLPQPTVGVPE